MVDFKWMTGLLFVMQLLQFTVTSLHSYTTFEKEGGRQQGSDSEVHLSVVTMTEHTVRDKVTLNCSVTSRPDCRHTVKWLYDEQNHELTPSHSDCSATVTFNGEKSNYDESFKCEVKQIHSSQGPTVKVQQFTFTRQTPSEKPGDCRDILISLFTSEVF
ncbi:hypothetical protein Q5P01_004631 [Channa striata]|uniref:Ig-like domain-containing protein n=1 Tax=Channa striata TaxID=64152 RepID=A0AA88T2D0_CHASR|nr:hypothetical protein Q5P01_004631 [Channa striata]